MVLASEQPAVKITFLVAAWNEEENLDAFLQSYFNLSYPHKEMVLCAGGEDRTYEKACQYRTPSLVLVCQVAGEGKQKALRKAFPHATGEIIVLTDADCLLEENCLQQLLEPILCGEECITNGSSRPVDAQLSNSFVLYQYASQQKAEAAMAKRKHQQGLFGRNCALRRTVLEEVGAFDEDVPIGTDSFLAKKVVAAGYQIRFTQSRIATEYPVSIVHYGHQRSRWWRNAILSNLHGKPNKRLMRVMLRVATSLTMLVLPLVGAIIWPLLYVWLALIGYAYWNRIQGIRALQQQQVRIPVNLYWKLPWFIFADSYTSVLTVYHLLSPDHRFRW